MAELESKLADHAFEMIKFFISLVTFVAGLYVTLLGAYVAYSTSDFAEGNTGDVLFWFMIAISVGTGLGLWFAHWLVRKTAIRYGRYLNGLSSEQQNEDVQRGLEMLLPVGFALAIIGTLVVSLSVWVIWSI